MATTTTTTRSRRSIRVHDGELSTGATAIRGYGETIALLVALALFVASMVIASAPAQNAGIARHVQFGPTGGAATTGDVVQPTLDGATSTTAAAVAAPTEQATGPLAGTALGLTQPG